jgi:hypothetical protein
MIFVQAWLRNRETVTDMHGILERSSDIPSPLASRLAREVKG